MPLQNNDLQDPDSKKPVRGPLGKGPQPGGKYPRNIFTWILLLLVGGMLVMTASNLSMSRETISYSELLRRAEKGQVKEVTISSTSLVGKLKPEALKDLGEKTPESFEVILPPEEPKGLADNLTELGVDVSYDRHTLWVVLVNLLPWIMIFAVMYFFVFRQFRSSGAGMLGSFGRSRHRMVSKEQSKVNFEDVAGIDEAKDEVQEIIHFLRNPKKFQRLGGRIPRGVLLIGLPGCGKTLLARAIAGEADVPFFSISGSDFVEMFVGVGASRVRDLFKQAKENSPCIIFLDEIDAVGRKRGATFAGGGHDEREQTLNAILVEMDGFSTNDQVIVIAATNRADVLDHALTRPGRFDRQIYVPLPDVKGRMEILRVHAKKVKLDPSADLSRLARGTPMFSGADLEAIINEAALAATLADKNSVQMDDLEEARDKVRWGRARRSRVVDEHEKDVSAYHESGHALVQCLIEHADPLHKVSIIPRANMGGATFSLPEKDRTLYTREYCLAMIQVSFGGRVAEELFCGDISSGASMDIQQATEIARRMVMEWGMSEKLGFIRYAAPDGEQEWDPSQMQRKFSDRTAEIIDAEIQAIISSCYKKVVELIQAHQPELESLKQALFKYETLDSEEVKQILDGKTLDKPTVADLLAREKDKVAAEAEKTKSDSATPPPLPFDSDITAGEDQNPSADDKDTNPPADV